MKKIIFILFAVVSWQHALSQVFTISGLYYSVTSPTTVKVQNPYGGQLSGNLIIPSQVSNNGITYNVTDISDAAFSQLTGLTSVTIPDSVTSIGSSAFWNCTNLSSVTIPNSVTSIGSYAFRECIGLTSLTIPNSVSSIGSYAFTGCSRLISFTLPTSISTIANGTFRGCSKLTAVTIPNSVTSIGAFAFYECTLLTSVNIPDNVSSIGDSAFYYSGLTSLTIPNSVSSIGPFALAGCSGLTSIICNRTTPLISAGQIGNFNPSNCILTVPNGSLAAYQAAFGWKDFKTINCQNQLYNATTISACGSYFWSNNRQTYSASGYYSGTNTNCVREVLLLTINPTTDNITTITACDGYTWANNGATYTQSGTYTGTTSANCITQKLNLTIIPSTTNTTTISACASYTWGNNGETYTLSGTYTGTTTNCVTQKLNLTITPSSINTTSVTACDSYIWSNNGQTYTESGTYTVSTPNCETQKLNLTIIPSTTNTTTVSACDSYIWSNNGQTYTSSGTYIGATTNCVTQKLNLTIAPSATNITTISACGSYYWANNGQTYTSSGFFIGTTTNCVLQILNLTITPSSTNTTTISACGSYTWANTGQSYTSSGVYTGTTSNCVTEKLYLNIPTIPTIITSGGINYVVTSSTTVAVGGNIGASGSITIPAAVTTSCITYKVATISNSAFSGNAALTSVSIPNSVSSIGSNAFQSCYGLTSITIPNSVTSIGNDAFSGCSNLTKLVCDIATPLSINSNVFNQVNQGACSLLVPDASVAAYQAALVWKDFAPITAISTTYTTSWDYGVPTASINAVIAGNFITTGSFTAKNLTVNAGITFTIATGTNVKVTEALVNNGIISVSNGANLIQTSGTNTNSGLGTAIVTRNSNALKRLDYTMWSSPVIGTQTLLNFSPLTSAEPVRFYTYNPTTNVYNTIAPTTAILSSGSGYLIRMPNVNPLNLGTETPYFLGNETLSFPGVFTGTLNNGPITLNTVTNKFYAVGNPFPSTISADDFLRGNATDGILYFWRKTNGTAGTAYASYSLAGGAGTNGIIPNGTIQIGQGFIVKATTTTLTFTNAMRETTPTSTQFLKTKKPTDKSRVWLNLSNANGGLNQAMIAYIDGATLGVDLGYDGKYFNDSKIALTSSIQGEEYIIQARPSFDATDVVELIFKTDVAGSYNIALDSFDGVFASGQDIYLIDNLTGSETNLKAGSYNFTAAAGKDNTRFSLKYQKTLKVGTPTFDENNVKVYKNNGTIFVNATSNIKTIEVYDVQGRLIAKQMNVNDTKASITNLKEVRQMLIVKVRADDNSAASIKVLN